MPFSPIWSQSPQFITLVAVLIFCKLVYRNGIIIVAIVMQAQMFAALAVHLGLALQTAEHTFAGWDGAIDREHTPV